MPGPKKPQNRKKLDEYKNTRVLAERLINQYPERFPNATPTKIVDMLQKIATVESWDKNIVQKGGGPGRGNFQIENTTAPVAYQRYQNYQKILSGKNKKPLPNINLKVVEDAVEVDGEPTDTANVMSLTKDQQAMLTLSNMSTSAKFKGPIDVTKPREAWTTNHWAGSQDQLKERQDHWNDVMNSLKPSPKPTPKPKASVPQKKAKGGWVYPTNTAYPQYADGGETPVTYVTPENIIHPQIKSPSDYHVYETPKTYTPGQNAAKGTAEPMVGIDDPILNVVLEGPAALRGISKGISKGIAKAPSVLNPRYFKPNPEAYYRGVGKSGLDDALKTKVLRSKVTSEMQYGDDVYMSPDFKTAESMYSRDQAKSVGNPFSDSWKLVPAKDSKSYIAEIPKKSLTNLEVMNPTVVKNKGALPIDDINFYKQNWWMGYKPVKKADGGQISEAQQNYIKNIGRNAASGSVTPLYGAKDPIFGLMGAAFGASRFLPIPSTIPPPSKAESQSSIDKLAFSTPPPHKGSELAPELEPYLSSKTRPATRHEQISESFMTPEKRIERQQERTTYYDSKGNIIPRTTKAKGGQVTWQIID